jgi:membrane peptidoglycan carboxypeptidase
LGTSRGNIHEFTKKNVIEADGMFTYNGLILKRCKPIKVMNVVRKIKGGSTITQQTAKNVFFTARAQLFKEGFRSLFYGY